LKSKSVFGRDVEKTALQKLKDRLNLIVEHEIGIEKI